MHRNDVSRRLSVRAICTFSLLMTCVSAGRAQKAVCDQPLANDVHFHLINYIQPRNGYTRVPSNHGKQSWTRCHFRDSASAAVVLQSVFTGIGEFSIHKEFVSAKIAGEVASLMDPALDKILDFAGEVGLIVLIHNDMDTPFAKEGSKPAYLDEMKAVLKRHPKTTIIWAHTGMGRVVRPIRNHAANIAGILRDPAFGHVYFDISWDEVAKYIVASPDATRITADLINQYPDRFLFGTDEVAPSTEEDYLRVYRIYAPLWSLLDKQTGEKVRRENYEVLFDAARNKVRAWEEHNLSKK
jgi:Amidohydrolase